MDSQNPEILSTPSGSTSPSLLRRVKDPTDAEAWNLFVKIYTPLILFWLDSRGFQQADAEDVAQQVFKRFHGLQGQFEYDPSKSFRSWLKTMTQRLAINYAKSNRKHNVVQALEAHEAVPADSDADAFGPTLYTRMVVNEAFNQIRREFQARDAEIFLLRYRENWSSSEVARRYGIRASTVRKACERIRTRLQDLLGEFLG